MQRQSEDNYRNILDQVNSRLEALDRIEEKLLQLRELASYAASRHLNEKEANEVQEWVDILTAEIKELDESTAVSSPLLRNLYY